MKIYQKSVRRPNRFHTGSWALLMIITYIIGLQLNEANTFGTFTSKFLGNYALFMAVFYGFFSFLVPRILRSRWPLFLLISLLLFGVFYILRHYIDYVIFEPENAQYALMEGMSAKRLESRIVGGLVIYFFWSGLAVFIRLLTDWFEDERLKAELKNQQLDSELAYLRSQVNPHFLFNTLNNIYALAYKNSEHTAEAIMKLSLMMRYMLYETNEGYVALDKEIGHLHNYIELQKLRRKDQDWVNFQIQGDTSTGQVAPLLLVPLLENAFKHSDPKSRIEMKLDVRGDILHFYIANTYSDYELKDGVGGVGLKNIRRRLQLIYPEAHQMKISREDGRFEVLLDIDLAHVSYEKA